MVRVPDTYKIWHGSASQDPKVSCGSTGVSGTRLILWTEVRMSQEVDGGFVFLSIEKAECVRIHPDSKNGYFYDLELEKTARGLSESRSDSPTGSSPSCSCTCGRGACIGSTPSSRWGGAPPPHSPPSPPPATRSFVCKNVQKYGRHFVWFGLTSLIYKLECTPFWLTGKIFLQLFVPH